MTLAAGDDERAVERAAPPRLDGVAERLDIARLAENTMIEPLAARRRPLQHLDGAVDGDAFFVAGDEERERAFFRLAAIGREMVERRRHEAGDGAFHIDRAAAVEHVAGHHAGERRMFPRRFVARRHDVGVAGEHESGFGVAGARVEVFDRRSARRGECQALHRKSTLLQNALQIGERPALLRRDRAAADKRAGNGDRIGIHDGTISPNPRSPN